MQVDAELQSETLRKSMSEKEIANTKSSSTTNGARQSHTESKSNSNENTESKIDDTKISSHNELMNGINTGDKAIVEPIEMKPLARLLR